MTLGVVISKRKGLESHTGRNRSSEGAWRLGDAWNKGMGVACDTGRKNKAQTRGA